jgi:ATP-dependent RNA helicase SUPV3L1/SUV3
MRAREADDEIALGLLAADPEVRALATHPDAIRLLWDVCQIPDFRKVMSDAHTRLLKRIYRHLMEPAGRLPADWVADHVQRLDRTDGDIETLASRIANIRTWTYVAYQTGWLADALLWQERTRAVEDRLSDALHERLTQRIVDRRTAHLVSRMKARQDLLAAVSARGDVLVEGHFVGRLEGFRFVPDAGPHGTAAERTVTGAAHKALRGEIVARVGRLEDAGDDAFRFGSDATIEWRGAPVARLVAGPTPLKPQVEALASDLLESGLRERVRRRLAAWAEDTIARGLKPLFAVRDTALAGAARGLAFQLYEALGSLPRAKAERQIAALSKGDRQTLRRLGVTIGRESVFLRALLKPPAIALRARLWSIHRGVPVPVPPPGHVSTAVATDTPRDAYEAIGYRPLGPVAIRLDMVERLAAWAWALARVGPFAADGRLRAFAGCTATELGEVLAALGFNARATADGVRYHPPRRRKDRARAGRAAPASDAHSPFAKLRDLAFPS